MPWNKYDNVYLCAIEKVGFFLAHVCLCFCIHWIFTGIIFSIIIIVAFSWQPELGITLTLNTMQALSNCSVVRFVGRMFLGTISHWRGTRVLRYACVAVRVGWGGLVRIKISTVLKYTSKVNYCLFCFVLFHSCLFLLFSLYIWKELQKITKKLCANSRFLMVRCKMQMFDVVVAVVSPRGCLSSLLFQERWSFAEYVHQRFLSGFKMGINCLLKLYYHR